MTCPPAVTIIHLGAREHYALPRMFRSLKFKVCMVTDFYMRGPWTQLENIVPRHLKRRFHSELGPVRIRHCPFFALRYSLARRRAKGPEQAEEVFNRFGSEFSSWACTQIQSPPDTIVSFSSTALEVFEKFKSDSLLVLDQIDGGPVEDQMVEEERIRFPDWETPHQSDFSRFWNRTLKEWELSDRIVVNSGFSRDCLAKKGVDPHKIHVIPLGFETPQCFRTVPERPRDDSDPINLIFVGQVCLRKGIHYLCEAVKMLRKEGERVNLTIVGPNHLNSLKYEELKASFRVLPPVGKQEVIQLIAEHDILVLPSIAEGFGMVQLEALACGRPVVISRNCGLAVREGETGEICEPFSSRDIALKIKAVARRLENDFNLPARCQETAGEFSLENIASEWSSIIKD